MLQFDELVNLKRQSAGIIRNVGEYIAKNFQSVKSISYKDSRDFFTEIDVEAENRLKKQLQELLPEAGFILEEGENSLKSTYNWTIDPLDQTKNYATRLPLFFTQIALLENNQPILGHIYEPLSKQLFSASRNAGATLNSDKLYCDESRTIKDAIVNLDIAGNTDLNYRKSLISELMSQIYRLRISPAFSIYLTTGSIDGFIGIYKDEKYIDLAPREVIIKESGFNIDFFEYNNLKFFIAANKKIFPILKDILKKIKEN